MPDPDQIHLVADLSLIHTNAKWRYPGSWNGYGPYGDPSLYLDLARLLERGRFDGAFFADVAGTPMVDGRMDDTIEWGVAWPRHDPIPTVVAMSTVTEHLGFVSTMSMTYNHPFHVARMYASLDHVTGGRIALNAVVSGFPQEAQNYGYPTTPDHAWRYRRGEEFQEVLAKLWASVEPGGMLWDRDSGRVADPSKFHRIDHEGEHFRVMGPLPVAPPPQGRPVQVMAGQSDDGMRITGRYADVHFAGIRGLSGMTEHRARLDAAAVAAGRDPRDVAILWSSTFDVVSGPEEEREHQRLYAEMHPERMAMVFLSQWWGMDGRPLDPDRPVHETIAEIKAEGTHYNNWGYLEEALRTTDASTKLGEYAREWLLRPVGGFIGTPEQIADQLEEAHHAGGACGGFMLYPRIGSPGGFARFVDEVVPVLQRRGLMRTEYTGRTLRENLMGR